jgi:hypothetical protein
VDQCQFGTRKCPQQKAESNNCALFSAWFQVTLLRGHDISEKIDAKLPQECQRSTLIAGIRKGIERAYMLEEVTDAAALSFIATAAKKHNSTTTPGYPALPLHQSQPTTLRHEARLFQHPQHPTTPGYPALPLHQPDWPTTLGHASLPYYQPDSSNDEEDLAAKLPTTVADEEVNIQYRPDGAKVLGIPGLTAKQRQRNFLNRIWDQQPRDRQDVFYAVIRASPMPMSVPGTMALYMQEPKSLKTDHSKVYAAMPSIAGNRFMYETINSHHTTSREIWEQLLLYSANRTQ